MGPTSEKTRGSHLDSARIPSLGERSAARNSRLVRRVFASILFRSNVDLSQRGFFKSRCRACSIDNPCWPHVHNPHGLRAAPSRRDIGDKALAFQPRVLRSRSRCESRGLDLDTIADVQVIAFAKSFGITMEMDPARLLREQTHVLCDQEGAGLRPELHAGWQAHSEASPMRCRRTSE